MQRQRIPLIKKDGPDLSASRSSAGVGTNDDNNRKEDEVAVNAGRVGRRSKPPEEKESKLVGLMLTPEEYNNLKERAGLAPAAAVLKDHLRRETDFFAPVNQAS